MLTFIFNKTFNKVKEEPRHFISSLVMGCVQPYSDTFMSLCFAEYFKIFLFWSDLKQISFPVSEIYL